MYGENPVRKQDLDPDGKLHVQEIFHTIQGEGPFAGRPAIFIRLAGCNLKCWWCDTDFETNYDQQPATVTDILYEIGDYDCNFVVLTGGEPFRQNITPLCHDLLFAMYDVQIETAGTLWVPDMELCLHDSRKFSIVVSPKTPKVHRSIWYFARYWKYIIRHGEVSAEDGLPLRSTQKRGAKAHICRPPRSRLESTFVQPCDEHNPDRNKLNIRETINSAMRFKYRISLQQHKIMELP